MEFGSLLPPTPFNVKIEVEMEGEEEEFEELELEAYIARREVKELVDPTSA